MSRMPTHSLAVIMTIIIFTLPLIASAHDPTLHGFRLVTFKRSIAAPGFALENLIGDVVELGQA